MADKKQPTPKAPEAPKEAPKAAPGFGKVNPKVEKALEKTPQGYLSKILKKATPRKGGSK